MESTTSSVSTASCYDERFAHNMWNPMMELVFHEQIGGAFEPLWTKLTWRRSHSLLILLLICSATRKVLTIPHDASSGTITAENEHTHSPLTQVVSMDSLEVGSRMETRTLPIWPEELTLHPATRSPIIRVSQAYTGLAGD